jgi:hypothetical protein
MSARTASRAMLLPWMSEKTATRISIRLNEPGPKTLLFWRKMSPPRRYDLHVAWKLDANTRKCIGRALGALLRELHTSQIYDGSWRPVTKTLLVIKRTAARQCPPEGSGDRWPALRGTITFCMKRVACPAYTLLTA